MKSTLLFFALTIFSVTLSHAQGEKKKDEQSYLFSKGDYYASGTINYSSFKNPESSDTQRLTLSPSVGYFISNHFALNAGLIFASNNGQSNINNAESEDKTTGITLGSTYFFSPKKQFTFSVKLEGVFSKRNVSLTNSFDGDINSTQVILSPGFNYFISEHFALQLSTGALSYVKSNTDNTSLDSFNFSEFGANLSLSNIGLGVIYKF